jgi:hypothetical protein
VRHFPRICNTLSTICVLLLALSCTKKKAETSFVSLPDSKTNISFSNTLTQTAEFNIIEYLYFYNGGGVAAGDINNDGLVDLYFSANQLSNRLYLNKGEFVFEDITEKSGVGGVGNWKTGVSMADVNGDGYLDIFVCGVGNYKNFNGRNQLYINNGDLTFTEETETYGLNFQGFSTHAAFFDYDNDGDVDMYLLNHSVHTARSYGHSGLRFQSDPYAGDKLYRNDLVPDGKHHFTEVTSAAGIYNSQVAYGLGVGISDLNLDGFMDIYVSNDFHENDYLYINQGDGTFREELKNSIPHVSRFSMGNDIADINNDGLADIVTLDMLPRDEEVIKTTAGEDPFDIYNFKLRFGYHHQFARNTLQLNRGFDRDGHLLFSDIATLAGVEASDWSWAPLIADFDNDGAKDLFIANGILTRPNDLDYINFISSDSAQRYYDYESFIRNMPSGKVPNLILKNSGSIHFKDVSKEWIGEEPTFSTGAAYADLDNDGDLDLVINNVNDKATLFRNDLGNPAGSWIQLDLVGEGSNRFGIGTKVLLYSEDKLIYQEQLLSRGWQSSISPVMHIGLGDLSSIDSISIVWPDQEFQVLTNVNKNQRLKVFQKEARGTWDHARNKGSQNSILLKEKNLTFMHRENNFNAFNEEKLIPHMVSTQGPDISVGDVNGDQLEDFFIGGAAGQSGAIFIQNRAGDFLPSHQTALSQDSLFEDVGSAFFDADGDGSLDLVVVSGGQEFAGGHSLLQPRLYTNDGRGKFMKSKQKLPELSVDASCVKPVDVDGDNDLDLFIGGRVVARRYGLDPESFLLFNDGKGNFTNESSRLPGEGANGKMLGMVTDAWWSDLNGDAKTDLVLVGEWMPITILIQDRDGFFHDKTGDFGLLTSHGWWNTLEGNDFDNDGDIDFVAGNLGLNSRLKAAPDEPVTLFTGDIDHNGGTDHLLTYFNQGNQHPFISRDQLVKQVPSFKREFLEYSNFRKVTREQIIPAKDTALFEIKRAYCFSSVYMENKNGKFTLHSLPAKAQMFPIFSFYSRDINGDGNVDLLAAGNLYSVQPEFGRYDAGYGLLMLGDGKGNFGSLSLQTSGFIVKGEARDINLIRNSRREDIFLVSRNNDSLLVFMR